MPKVILSQDYGSPRPGVKRVLYVIEEGDKRVGIFIDYTDGEKVGEEPPKAALRALEIAGRSAKPSFIARLGAALQKLETSA